MEFLNTEAMKEVTKEKIKTLDQIKFLNFCWSKTFFKVTTTKTLRNIYKGLISFINARIRENKNSTKINFKGNEKRAI